MPPLTVTIGEPVSGPPTDTTGSNKGKIIAAVIVVLALVGVGVFFLTRSDDSKSTTDSTTATVDTTDTTGVDTSVPSSVSPDTASSTVDTTATSTDASTAVTGDTTAPTVDTVPATDVPATTVPYAVPAGAIDLGHQVYLPIPDGWSQTSKPGEVVVVSDGAGSSASFQALARNAGEDVSQLTQQYTDTFDKDFTAVGFGPMRFVRSIDGPLPVDQYSMYYTTYEPGDVKGIDGAITIFVRSDGLSLVYDSYSTSGLVPLTDASYQGMIKSMLDAEPLGDSVPLVQHDPFRVTSVSPFVEVSGVIGFTTTPGFNTDISGSGHAQADNGTETVEVISANGLADTNGLIAAAQGYLGNTESNAAYGAPTEDAPDTYGVVHGTFTWTATTSDGSPSAGVIDYYLDPATQNAYVMFRSWKTTNGPDEPFAAEGAFMRRSFYDSLTTIP